MLTTLYTYRIVIIRKEGTEMTQVDDRVWFWLLMLVMLIGAVLYWRQIHQKEQFQVVLLSGNSPKEVQIEAAGVWQAKQQAEAMMMKAGVRGIWYGDSNRVPGTLWLTVSIQRYNYNSDERRWWKISDRWVRKYPAVFVYKISPVKLCFTGLIC